VLNRSSADSQPNEIPERDLNALFDELEDDDGSVRAREEYPDGEADAEALVTNGAVGLNLGCKVTDPLSKKRKDTRDFLAAGIRRSRPSTNPCIYSPPIQALTFPENSRGIRSQTITPSTSSQKGFRLHQARHSG